ncbi:MAG: hypothetical protein ACC707_04480, partial [Thiohalomonadales bacterium]
MANAQQTTLVGTVYQGAIPISGAIIVVRDQDSKKEWLRKSTDALGRYQLNVPIGLHQLEVELPSAYQTPTHYFQNVRLTTTAAQYHLVIRSANNQLRGRVLAENGTPITQVDVLIADSEHPNRLIKTKSDQNGDYRIALSSGTYALSIEGKAGEYFPRNWNARSIVTDLRIDGDHRQDILLDKSKLSWALVNKKESLTVLRPKPSNAVILADVQVSKNTSSDLDNQLFYLSVHLIDNNRLSVQQVPVSLEDAGVTALAQVNKDAITVKQVPLNLVSNYDGMITAKLLAGHSYKLRVIPRKRSGFKRHDIDIESVSKNISTQVVLFQTENLAPTLTSGPNIKVLENDSVLVEWRTNIPTTGTLSYGLRGILIYNESSTSKTVNHSVILNKLIPDSHYEIRLKITDLKGKDGSTHYKASFKSGRTNSRKILPLNAQPTVTDLGLGRMKIRWNTERKLSATIEYQQNRVNGQRDSVHKSKMSANTMNHSIVLEDLQPAMSYQYRIVTSDTTDGRISHLYYFNTKNSPNTQEIRIVDGPRVTDITKNSAWLHWRTNIPVKSSISIRTGSAANRTLRGSDRHRIINEPKIVAEHKVYIDGLQANTPYEYVVAAVVEGDDNKLSRVSSIAKQFDTVREVNRPPARIVRGPHVVRSSSRAIVQWTTGYPTESIVYYGPSVERLRKHVYKNKYTHDHVVELGGLRAGRKYYYKIISKWQPKLAARANSGVYFVTQKVKDHSPPKIIVPPKIQYEGRDSVMLRWQTNEFSYAEAQVSDLNGNQQVFRSTDMNSQHEIFLPGLQPGMRYTVQVTNIDLSGNRAPLTVSESLLLSAGLEVAPAKLNDWQVEKLSDSQVKIIWKTDKLSRSILRYNLDGKFDSQMKSNDLLAYQHSEVISGLKAGARYEFFIVSTNLDGQTTLANKDMRFTT